MFLVINHNITPGYSALHLVTQHVQLYQYLYFTSFPQRIYPISIIFSLLVFPSHAQKYLCVWKGWKGKCIVFSSKFQIHALETQVVMEEGSGSVSRGHAT